MRTVGDGITISIEQCATILSKNKALLDTLELVLPLEKLRCIASSLIPRIFEFLSSLFNSFLAVSSEYSRLELQADVKGTKGLQELRVRSHECLSAQRE